MTKTYLKDLTHQINSAAIDVHKFLGPGLLQCIYHECLKKELSSRGFIFQSDLLIPIKFKEVELKTDLKCSLLVENCIVVEVKATESLNELHQAQLLNYMKLFEAPIGILFNFNAVNLFSEGQKTFVNEIYRNSFDAFSSNTSTI